MEIEKPKSRQKKREKSRKENVEDQDPVSNLSRSVDISGELLCAATDTIHSAIDSYQVPATIEKCGTPETFIETHETAKGTVLIANDNNTDNDESIKAHDLGITIVNAEKGDNIPSVTISSDASTITENIESQTPEITSNPVLLTIDNIKDNAESIKSYDSSIPIDSTDSDKTTSCKDYNTFLAENKVIVSTIENKIENQAEPKSDYKLSATSISKPAIKRAIKAYSEQQLSALYANTELEALDQFTQQFIEAELKGLSIKQHPLFDLLTNYLNVRVKITGNSLEIEQLRKEYKETHSLLWNLNSSVISGRAECQDGNIVVATHTYTKATFQRTVFQNTARILASIRLLSNESHTLYTYSAEVLNIQINLYLQTLITNCINASQLQENAAVCLTFQDVPSHLSPFLCDLRLCISVLFSFQRRIIRDTQFIKESREWLGQLVSVLLRLANWQDHLFLINHVLRCPAGVGEWASIYIQAPLNEWFQESPFSNREINHIITVLALLLKPIDKRGQFLQDFSQTKDSSGDNWVVVDSEGEEDEATPGVSLRENDLVAFLNQLPLDNLFRVLLLVRRRDNQNYYDSVAVTEHHILKFFAFSTTLLRILQAGLNTYDQPRYNQFSKRLSRFIRHIVQYATDQWELFKSSQNIEDVAMLQRLQVEYDAFFLRATYFLYTSQKLGAWQFLAIVPYNLVSVQTLWKIYYLLHDSDSSPELILDPVDDTDYESKLWNSSTRSQFEEKLVALADGECYYLLNTFANMALARTESDLSFIRAATKDLLEVGYISAATQETCCKNARILLTHITSKYPYLLSDVLKIIKENIFSISTLCLHLYEELPLSIWHTTEEDLDVMTTWLTQNSMASAESRLARMILSRLNWDISNEGILFLPHNIHCRVALLAAQVIQLDQGYTTWAWQTIFRLKLHMNDKGSTELTKIREPEHFDVIFKGIRDQQMLPCFLAVLMTSWGHLVPLVCTKGLKQLLLLESHQKYEATIFGLHMLVPLFIECQESLINVEPFQSILVGMLNADRTYMNMAKSIMVPQNTIIEQFGHMIEYQIANYRWYDLQSPRCLVRLWINSLVSVPQWNKDFGVMYLLDVIIRAAFFYSDAMDVVTNILRDLLQCSTPQESSNSIGSLFKWVSQSNSQNLLISGSLSSCSYLAYVLIGLEHEEKEKLTGLWQGILIQLRNQKGKVNVDAAIKKAASSLKLPSFSSAALSIFRWAQQALDTPIGHPVLALLWQKFFGLFLCRITSSGGDLACVGGKFFEGLINLTFLKKIKKRLQDTVDYYTFKIKESQETGADQLKILFYANCQKLFQAYILWLEEPRLQEVSLYLPNLPPHYEPQLLSLIIQGSASPWMEYVDYEEMEREKQKSTKAFKCANYRERTNVNLPLANAGSTLESQDPLERILRRLNSYDAPQTAPILKQIPSIVPHLNFNDKSSMFLTLQPYFKTLLQFAHNFGMRISEHNALDCMYQELVPQLYRSVLHKVKKQIPCKGVNKTVHCSGSAVIVLQMQEARINDRIEHQIQTNRNEYESLLSNILRAPASSLCVASVALQHVINILQMQLRTHPSSIDMGVELFYYILSLLNEETNNFLPTKQLFTTCLEKLGQSHICGLEFETPRLLNKILEDPSLGVYLAPHFCPVDVGTANFLLMYSDISKDTGQRYDTIFALLSKFDVPKWLSTKQPKLKQRSQFIELVIQSLTKLGFEPADDAQILHEVYRKHLRSVFEYQFPEHFGEVLMGMLKVSNGGTDAGCVAISVWMDLLNSISRPVPLKLNSPLRDHLRTYAQHQQMLQYQELLDLTSMLSRHFTQERLQYGLYGLYPKTRNYIEVFVLLLGLTGHALVISSLNTHQGLLGDRLCEIIWPHLRDLFSPWIIPYWMQNLKDNMATWIQQLADDRAVLLPWIPADGPYAQKAVHMFFECIHFIIQTLPGCNKILSFIWHWYVTNYAHTSVKDHILNVVHSSFLALPWHNFWPSVSDLEQMLKVVEQYLPESHVFLGCIFMEVSWPSWLKSISDSTPLHIRAKIQQCLLHLLVKLSNEPNVRNNHSDKAKSLLVEAEEFNWNHIEANVYQQVLDWYVMSCDPLVLFKTDPLNLDFRILKFLQAVAGYDKAATQCSPSFIQKRHMFVRSYVKLIAVFTSRYKALIPNKEVDLNLVITEQLNHMEQVVTNTEELHAILSEYFEILNQSIINKSVTKCFEQWLATKPSDGSIIKAVLHTVSVSVCDTEISANLFETALNSYFTNNAAQVYSWQNITNEINIFPPKQSELEQSLLTKGCFLTLHALMLKKMENCKDFQPLLNTGLEWLSNIKLSENIECKVPLIWADVLTLAFKFCAVDEACAGAILYKFSQILSQHSDEKEVPKWGRGILGAIGIVKQTSASLPFKFLCRALAGYVLAQLPDMKGNPQVVRFQPNSPCIVGHAGGNSECAKILLKLDFGQSQGQIKDCAELALKQIQDPANSLHNVKKFLLLLVNQMYMKSYLKDIG